MPKAPAKKNTKVDELTKMISGDREEAIAPEVKAEETGVPENTLKTVTEPKAPEKKEVLKDRKPETTEKRPASGTKAQKDASFDVTFEDIKAYGSFRRGLMDEKRNETMNISIAIEREMKELVDRAAGEMEISVSKLISVILYKSLSRK